MVPPGFPGRQRGHAGLCQQRIVPGALARGRPERADGDRDQGRGHGFSRADPRRVWGDQPCPIRLVPAGLGSPADAVRGGILPGAGPTFCGGGAGGCLSPGAGARREPRRLCGQPGRLGCGRGGVAGGVARPGRRGGGGSGGRSGRPGRPMASERAGARKVGRAGGGQPLARRVYRVGLAAAGMDDRAHVAVQELALRPAIGRGRTGRPAMERLFAGGRGGERQHSLVPRAELALPGAVAPTARADGGWRQPDADIAAHKRGGCGFLGLYAEQHPVRAAPPGASADLAAGRRAGCGGGPGDGGQARVGGGAQSPGVAGRAGAVR